jgi:hypothetical protein
MTKDLALSLKEALAFTRFETNGHRLYATRKSTETAGNAKENHFTERDGCRR